jgi:hypothetical protein
MVIRVAKHLTVEETEALRDQRESDMNEAMYLMGLVKVDRLNEQTLDFLIDLLMSELSYKREWEEHHADIH